MRYRTDSAYIDFETRSAVDLKVRGASVYAQDPSTSILCCVIKRDGVSKAFTDFARQKNALLEFIEGATLVAHNALFEQLLWKYILVKEYGYPSKPPRSWRDTMAKLLSHGLPRSLEKGADALNLLVKKDMAGKKLMLKMCQFGYNHTDAELRQLIEYCAQDNHTAEAIDLALPDLSVGEQRLWELDQEINLRGIKVDVKLIDTIIDILGQEKEELLVEFNEATCNEVSSPTKRQSLKDWLSRNGLDLPDLTSGTLAKVDLSNSDGNIRDAVRIRQTLSKSSTAKYKTILNQVDNDGRMRGNLIFHAASTGRWGGTGAQLQNLPRPRLDAIKEIARLRRNKAVAGWFWTVEYGSCNDAAKSLIRATLIPKEGKKFIWGDFSGIEARVLAWVAGEELSLEVFRRGEDAYCYSASSIYGRKITKEDKDERKTGKGATLAFGYQGGIAALFKISTASGISLAPVSDFIWDSATGEEREKAEKSYALYVTQAAKSGLEYYAKKEGLAADIIKQRWRMANRNIVSFWSKVNDAAMEAVLTGKTVICGPVYWHVEGMFLYCMLPGRRRLAYYKPMVSKVVNKFGTEKQTLTYLTLDSKTNTLVRRPTYGGLLTENIVQAISRDIMATAMINCENAGHKIVLTVHDELLIEADLSTEKKEIEAIMTKPIHWCNELPLAAGLFEGDRYGK